MKKWTKTYFLRKSLINLFVIVQKHRQPQNLRDPSIREPGSSQVGSDEVSSSFVDIGGQRASFAAASHRRLEINGLASGEIRSHKTTKSSNFLRDKPNSRKNRIKRPRRCIDVYIGDMMDDHVAVIDDERAV